MKCPVDEETLVMADRNGVEIDYCPKCRGVWLDRGELDKIVERSISADGPQQAREQRSHPRDDHRHARDEYRHPRDDYRGYKRKKRESFLGELFDF